MYDEQSLLDVCPYFSTEQSSFTFLILVNSLGMSRLSIFLSLIQYHFTVFALTIPLPTTNLSGDRAVPNILTNSDAHCAQAGPTSSPSPLSSDCVRAIRSLPQSDYVGFFHIGGDTSLWRLPTSRSYDSCTVLVLLNADFDMEMGSWTGVQTAAVTLWFACRLPIEAGGEQRTGGWIAAGAENGLVVKLGRSRRVGINETRVGSQPGTYFDDVE